MLADQFTTLYSTVTGRNGLERLEWGRFAIGTILPDGADHKYPWVVDSVGD